MDLLQSLINTPFYFRLISLTMTEVIDLLLVAVGFYLLLSMVRHSRAAFLLRGVLILTSVLFVVTVILPLAAFNWLVRILLIAVLVATPMTFQPELRRLMEQIGRAAGMSRDVQQTTVEEVSRRLVRAITNMSDSRTGALIVLEGSVSLRDVVETGVSISGRVTSELLQAIFYPSNPLHDGAVIVHDDRLVAAGCVLPLTQRSLPAQRRLGTRHRAAVGLSEVSDALVIVVSEETGQISAAHGGQLHRPLDDAALRKHLFDFYTPSGPTDAADSLWELLLKGLRQLRQEPPLPAKGRFPSNASFVVITILLAWAFWAFVMQQTNPATRDRFDNVPLDVENIPSGTTLVTPVRETVSVIFLTTDAVRPTLSQDSFQAFLSLEGLSPGLNRVPIQVGTSVSRVQVLDVEPMTVDLELAPVISQTRQVNVELTDAQGLSRAYEVIGAPLARPEQVEIEGAKPLLDRVAQVQADLSIANATASLREMRPLRVLDEAGREVAGVRVQPAQAEVRVLVQRRQNARDVGVRVVTEGVPAPGYWVSSLSVTPSNVTLEGEPEQLAEVENHVNTLPVNVGDAAGNLSLQIPLDLPADVQALDSNGNPAKTVSVQAKIIPRHGNLAVSREVQVLRLPLGSRVNVNPTMVELLLSGPLPTLNAIEANPDLIRVTVDAADLGPGQASDLPINITAPEDIQVQPSPDSVLLTVPSDDVEEGGTQGF